ncbi:MAG TPA: cystathionine gamma-synthase [Bdellovibrionota bacterium]|nr:cystathionine gamma-synthase [Bdellovibrionota bacterium]
MKDEARFETRAIHVGQAPDPSTGAVIQPIYQTSTYAQSAPGEHKGYDYSRTRNPTREALERCLASLEGGKHGAAFSSGMGAAATLLHLLEEGSHVVCCDDVYGGTYRLFSKVLHRRNYTFSFVDLTNPKAFDDTVTAKTRMVWIETPTNPLLKLIDIEAICSKARKKKILSVVDNTFASPYLQNPLALGADIVLHSTTKYIGGHSDVVGGAVAVGDDALAERIRFLQNSIGAVPGPFDAWLTLRGLKTLALRMERHTANAKAIVTFLEKHPKVEQVFYPGLASHPQHALAKKQMKDFGGMISARLKLNLQQTKKFLSSLKIFTLAESLGGVESLIEHPAIMTHASLPPDVRGKLGITDGFIRLSVGIEHADDLLNDLRAALDHRADDSVRF